MHWIIAPALVLTLVLIRKYFSLFQLTIKLPHRSKVSVSGIDNGYCYWMFQPSPFNCPRSCHNDLWSFVLIVFLNLTVILLRQKKPFIVLWEGWCWGVRNGEWGGHLDRWGGMALHGGPLRGYLDRWGRRGTPWRRTLGLLGWGPLHSEEHLSFSSKLHFLKKTRETLTSYVFAIVRPSHCLSVYLSLHLYGLDKIGGTRLPL